MRVMRHQQPLLRVTCTLKVRFWRLSGRRQQGCSRDVVFAYVTKSAVADTVTLAEVV